MTCQLTVRVFSHEMFESEICQGLEKEGTIVSWGVLGQLTPVFEQETVMKVNCRKGERLMQAEKLNQLEPGEVKGLMFSDHALPDKSKFHCLRIISVTEYLPKCSGSRICWLAVESADSRVWD
jgi:hypothetical protein